MRHRHRPAHPAAPGTVLRLALSAVLAAASWAGTAAPAHAHAADRDRATNYRTELVAVPEAPGLQVRLVDNGSLIEVSYTGPGEVVVSGYADEPYLRIGPGGVFTNRQSPATYLNADASAADVVVPVDVDAHAAPSWERVGDGPTARWHDHRIHWMGLVDPPAVQDAPGQRHVVIDDARIPLRIGATTDEPGRPGEVVADVVWVPPPSPWPWVALGSIAVAAAALVSRRWGARAIAPVVGAVTGTSAAATVGAAATSATVPPPTWWVAVLVGAGVAAVAGAVLVRRDRPWAGAALLGAGGLTAAGVVGIADHAWLSRSQLPLTLDPSVARTLVATTVTAGLACAAVALATAIGARRAGAVSPR